MGFDLVTFSGGKHLRGPQSAGLLLGRKDLIEAARMNTCPNSDSIGRGLKVNKEELIAMMIAVESYLRRDHAADLREGERRVKIVADALRSIPSVKTRVEVPPIAFHVPHLHIDWNQSKISVEEVVKRLRDGDPSIEVWPFTTDHLVVNLWMAEPGDAEIVARRIRDVLQAAIG
jgi:L-seryl-tRNA(Ser) seleniumtransferase